jgi:hypothetical protein
MPGSKVFAVIGGTPQEPRAAYLAKSIPVTAEVLALAGQVSPTEVFRIAAPCAGSGCQHFDGKRCTLAQRTVQLLAPVVDAPPPCRLRPQCRWWQQEGQAACLRCPQIVTQLYVPSELLREAAAPPGANPAAR